MSGLAVEFQIYWMTYSVFPLSSYGKISFVSISHKSDNELRQLHLQNGFILTEGEDIKYAMNKVTFESTKQTMMFTPAGFTVYEASGLK